ncbi:MAG: hypothetical protein QOJ89_2160 [bacterium]
MPPAASRAATLASVEVVLILVCVFVIIGLTYMGAGAWLRDRERSAAHRRRQGGGGEDGR